MFGKKEKNTPQDQPVITARIETMPGAFYGGADPVIYPEQVEKLKTVPPTPVVTPPPLPPPQVKKPVLPPPVSPTNTSPNTKAAQATAALQKPIPKPAGSKKLFFLVVGIVVLLGILAVLYFAFFANTSAPETPVTPVVPTVPFEPSPVTLPPTTTTSTVPLETATSTASSTPVIRGGGALTLPHILFAPAKDDDHDSLTNSEEEIFGVDPEVYDTDSDGYYDGQEVANLYNPKGIAPQKIIDSGLVKEYINPSYQYRFYYPANWRVDPVADDLKDVLVSADTGDYMEIRVFPKDENVSFATWFASTLPGENFTAFSSFQNRFQVTGYKRGDTQVGFFETPKAIYSVVYFYGEEEKNAFPHVMNVLLQSFRANKTGFDLPVQVILPGVVSSTPVSPTPATTTSSSTPVTISPTSTVEDI